MLTLFGATGYTGRLLAQELAAHGLPLRLAGRSAEKLAALASRLPGDPPYLVVDARDAAMRERLVQDTQLLISCAGPFTEIGEPVAALAARHGLLYIDSSNELGFVHEVYSRLDGLARASGATLIPACGFEVALADCLVADLAQEFADQMLDEVQIVYRLPGMGSSLGTRASALASLATSWLAYREGRFVATRPAAQIRQLHFAGKPADALAFPSSETVTVPARHQVHNVSTWMLVSRRGAMYASRLIPLIAPLLRGPFGAMLWRLSALRAGPPDAARRAAMPFGLEVTLWAGEQRVQRLLEGRDPYGITARVMAIAAGRMWQERPAPGVLPPAAVLDAAKLTMLVEEIV